MSSLHRLAGLLIAAIAIPSTSGEEWTQFRGPGGNGISTAKNLPVTWDKDSLAWKTDLPGPGTSSPVILGDRIFLTCYTGYNVPGAAAGDMEDLRRLVVCLDRESGKIAWTKEVPPKLPEIRGTRESHGFASSTPAVDADHVYVFFGKTGVFAFDHQGKQVWQADVGDGVHNNWGSAASPILFGDSVIINAGVESGALVALDRKSGKEKWRARGIRDAWGTPILVAAAGGKTELCVAIQGQVLGFDPATGEKLWSCVSEINTYISPSLVSNDGVVYCVAGRTNGSMAVRAGGRGDVTKTHRLWTSKKGSNVPSPLCHGGYLYWAHDGMETFNCADAKTGEVLYSQRLPRAGQIYPSPILADGRIYCVARDGRTFVIEPGPKFNQLAMNDLRDRSLFSASPAVSGNRILIRSDKALYCVEKK